MEPAVRRQLAGVALLGGIIAVSHLLLPQSPLAALGSLTGQPVVFAAVLAAVYLARPLVAWPISLVSVVVGYAYGVAVGLPIALAGAVGTSMAPYLLARYYDPEGGPLGRLAVWGREAFDWSGDTRGVTAARLAPVPADAISYGAGLANVSVSAFVVGTFVGEIPWTVAAVLAGSSLESLTVSGLAGTDPTLLVAMAVVAVVLLARPLHERLGRPTAE
jgi:uncharacterized membrane protein YdjX (TVP38/TMEM64 family)